MAFTVTEQSSSQFGNKDLRDEKGKLIVRAGGQRGERTGVGGLERVLDTRIGVHQGEWSFSGNWIVGDSAGPPADIDSDVTSW